jgi:hypothetical protein
VHRECDDLTTLKNCTAKEKTSFLSHCRNQVLGVFVCMYVCFSFSFLQSA